MQIPLVLQHPMETSAIEMTDLRDSSRAKAGAHVASLIAARIQRVRRDGWGRLRARRLKDLQNVLTQQRVSAMIVVRSVGFRFTRTG